MDGVNPTPQIHDLPIVIGGWCSSIPLPGDYYPYNAVVRRGQTDWDEEIRSLVQSRGDMSCNAKHTLMQFGKSRDPRSAFLIGT